MAPVPASRLTRYTGTVKSKQLLGAAGEARARKFLESRGYEFIASNVRIRRGEVDLVMRDGEELVFVEVKARRYAGTGLPEAAVTPRKLRHIVRVAETWRSTVRHSGPWRVDIVAIDPDGVRHHPNATVVY